MTRRRGGPGRYRWAAFLAGALVVGSAAGCGGSPSHLSVAPSTSTTAAPTTTTTTLAPTTVMTAPSTTPAPPPTVAATAAATFSVSVTAVTADQLGASWHAGCPVGPERLSDLHLDYWGFDGQTHIGEIVVAASVVPAVEHVFAALFAARFPLQEVVPQSAFGGNDDAAAAADDTSGFNCRYAVAPGPPQWSVHAYGEAIDVNDVQNPYVDGTTLIPPAGAPYRDRSVAQPGMAVPGGTLVDAFAGVGWQWGGRWTAAPDYQHFSATGG